MRAPQPTLSSTRPAAAREASLAEDLQGAADAEAAAAWRLLRAAEQLRGAERAQGVRAALAAQGRAEAWGRAASARAARPLPHARSPRLLGAEDEAGLPVLAEQLVAASAAHDVALRHVHGVEVAPIDDDVRALAAACPQAIGRAARRGRAWQAFLRASEGVGHVVGGLLLGVVWLVSGALLVLPSRARLRANAVRRPAAPEAP